MQYALIKRFKKIKIYAKILYKDRDICYNVINKYNIVRKSKCNFKKYYLICEM